MSETLPTKDEIRKRMREKRRLVKPEERKAAGKAICKKILEDPIRLLLRVWRISLYLSTKNEIPTRYIARAVWEAGREVCVPAWSAADEAYKLFLITPQMKLVPGHHGIREPLARLPVLPWDVDAFVLPGLAFDTLGGRLGFGAGHYDKILSKASKSATKIAVCHDWQIVDAPLPQEAHDIPMDWIVTDKRVIHCAENRAKAASTPTRPSEPENLS